MRKNYIVLSFIIILFILYSCRSIFAHDTMFLYDQSREIILVRDMLETHKLTLIGTRSGVGGLFHGPLWLYTLIPFYLMGQGDPLYLSYAYELLLITTIVSGFIIGKKLFHPYVGLLTAFFLATNSFLWPHVVYMHGLYALPLIYLWLFYFLLRFLRGHVWSCIGAIFFAGLSMQFEASSSLILIGLLPIILVGIGLFGKNIQRRSLGTISKRLRKNAVVVSQLTALSIFSLLLSLSTFLLFDLRHQFLTIRSLLSFFFHQGHNTGYLEMAQRFFDHTQSFLSIYTSMLFQPDSIYLFIAIVTLLVYLWYVSRKKHTTLRYTSETVLCLVFPVLMYIPFLFYGYPVYPEYISGMIAPISLGASLLVFNTFRTTIGKIFISIFFIYTYSSVLQVLLNQYLHPYIYSSSASSLRNQEEVVDWVYHDAGKTPFVYYVYSPDTFTYSLDYLFAWKGERQYRYLPSQQKLATTYLILNPPLQNDSHAHAFWKKNVIHTSAPVVESQQFPGDVIVEKLHIVGKEEPVDPNYFQNVIFR